MHTPAQLNENSADSAFNWADDYFSYSLNRKKNKKRKKEKAKSKIKKNKKECCEKYRKGKQCRNCPLRGLV